MTRIADRCFRLGAALRGAGAEHVVVLVGTQRGWVGAWPTHHSAALDPLRDDPEPLDPNLDAPRWVGLIPYEARRSAWERRGWTPVETRPAPLVETTGWWRYPAMLRVDDEVTICGHAGAGRRLLDAAQHEASISAPGWTVRDDDPPEAHLERIARAREMILDGDLYQVNLARRLAVTLTAGDPLALAERLHARAGGPFAAFLDLPPATVITTSPELLLRIDTRDGVPIRMVTEPIKGTRPRDGDASRDEALARELSADPKEIAELAMIVDVERHDLGAVATWGSVRIQRPPTVVTHPTVHHRSATLVATPRPDVDRTAILEAMLPSGSVTGAPKVRAMEVIAELEAHRRGLYTGGFGVVGHDGRVTLGMAIRTAVLRGGRGCYWTGGGIVIGSDPARELEETRWKAAQLEALRR